MGGAISLDLSGVSTQWPMISFIATDEIYYAQYKQYAKEFASTVFSPAKMYATYDKYSNLIRESAAMEVTGYTFLRSGVAGFDGAITQLKTQVDKRYSLALKLN
jgi:hypothetical protein